jgi:hypothetical protein
MGMPFENVYSVHYVVMLNSQYFNLKESNSTDCERIMCLFQQHLLLHTFSCGMKVHSKSGAGIESRAKPFN